MVGAFEADMARLGGRAPLARVLLAALAWAEGPGLPWDHIWVPVALALAGDGGPGKCPVSRTDVRWLLAVAGAYVVVDTGPGGRAVYRVRDELVAAHLRGEPGDGEPVGARRDRVARAEWQRRRAHAQPRLTAPLLATVPAREPGPRRAGATADSSPGAAAPPKARSPA